MTKRLISTLLLGTAITAGSTAMALAENVTINYVSWGGAYTESQVKAMIEPYRQMHPEVTINVIDYTGGLAQVRAQVEANNIEWHIVDLTPQNGIPGCDEGLFEEIDISTFPDGADGTAAADDFIEGGVLDCFVGNIVYTTVMAYNSTLVDGEPSTVADFWNLEQYPGKRSLRKAPGVTMEWGLEAMGVPRQEVYDTLRTDEGVTLAFEGLDKIKSEVVWWEAGAQPPQLLADGEVVMASSWNGRFYAAIVEEKQPIVIMWDTQYWDLDGFSIVKGSPNQDTILDFLKFATSSEVLGDSTNYISYGPMRVSSTPFINPEILPHLPTAPDNFGNAIQYDVTFWADHLTELEERFNAWLAK
jgi:putative spermidine/putrescine transport system substrate-binding protein